MVDTIRTVPELLALFADNITGDISPQDARDLIISSIGVYGGIHLTGGATAQTGISTTPVLLTGFTINDAAAGVIPDQSSNQLTIDVDGIYIGVFQITFGGTASVKLTFEFRVNGVVTGFAHSRVTTSGGDVESSSMFILTTLTKGQVVTVFVNSDTPATSITPEEMQLALARIG